MKNLMELKFGPLFSAYMNQLKGQEYQYLCESCQQRFSALWNLRASAMNPWVSRGSFARCPYCGTHHDKHVCVGGNGEFMPYKLHLTLQESKDALTVINRYKAFCFTGRYSTDACTGKEVFRFDVKKLTATFTHFPDADHPTQAASFDISSPFDRRLLDQSVLRFVGSNSLIRSAAGGQIVAFMKLLRESVLAKYRRKYGHKPVETLYFPYTGTAFGLFLLPLQNIAYRMVYSDLKGNILRSYEESHWPEQEHPSSIYDRITPELFQKVNLLRQKGIGTPRALLQAAELPETATNQRILSQDIYSYGKLIAAHSLVKNHDLANRLFLSLPPKMDRATETFLRFIGKEYGESGMVRMTENPHKYILSDCIRLYGLLTEENRKTIHHRTTRLRDLHDHMSLTHKKQQNPLYNFTVPQHIVSRLAMQTDRLRFYLPQDSMELLEAGHSLHNCVASYGKAVHDKEKMIVLIAADNGSLTGCLEIRENSIVQAKCDRNKSVYTDERLNLAVIEWAKKANLAIATTDIQTLSAEKKELKTA